MYRVYSPVEKGKTITNRSSKKKTTKNEKTEPIIHPLHGLKYNDITDP